MSVFKKLVVTLLLSIMVTILIHCVAKSSAKIGEFNLLEVATTLFILSILLKCIIKKLLESVFNDFFLSEPFEGVRGGKPVIINGKESIQRMSFLLTVLPGGILIISYFLLTREMVNNYVIIYLVIMIISFGILFIIFFQIIFGLDIEAKKAKEHNVKKE